MAMLTLRIDDELNDRIAALAKRSGRTKTYFIKRLILEAIEDLEDEIWAQEAVLEHRASIARGEDPEWVDFHELMKELDERDLENERAQARQKNARANAQEHSPDGADKTRGSQRGNRTGKTRKAS